MGFFNNLGIDVNDYEPNTQAILKYLDQIATTLNGLALKQGSSTAPTSSSTGAIPVQTQSYNSHLFLTLPLLIKLTGIVATGYIPTELLYKVTELTVKLTELIVISTGSVAMANTPTDPPTINMLPEPISTINGLTGLNSLACCGSVDLDPCIRTAPDVTDTFGIHSPQ